MSLPIAKLAEHAGKWTLSIVLYPSGPSLEIVDESGEFHRIVYGDQLANINLAAEALKKENPDA